MVGLVSTLAPPKITVRDLAALFRSRIRKNAGERRSTRILANAATAESRTVI